MKPAEVKEIYVEACRFKRRAPEAGEAKEWEKSFAFTDAVDLRTALSAWWNDSTAGPDGQPRSVWFPQVSQLRPMAETAQRKRAVSADQCREFVVWQCPVCSGTRSGWPEPGDIDRRRNCLNWAKGGGRCGAIMQIIRRDREAAA